MNSNISRVVAGVAIVVVAIVLLIVLKDSGSNTDSSKPGAVTTITVEGGKPVGGVAELTYSRGEQVRFEVESDTGDEIHIHGYDLMEDVEAGGSVSFSFPATIEGVFEVELEGRKEQIAQLTVNP